MNASKQAKITSIVTAGVLLFAAVGLFANGLMRQSDVEVTSDSDEVSQYVDVSNAAITDYAYAGEISLSSTDVYPVLSTYTDAGTDDLSEEITEENETEAEALVEEEQEDEEVYDIDNFCIADVEYYLNVRKEPYEDSEVIAILPHLGGGVVLEYGEEYSKIVSGDVTGYIVTDCAWFGDMAWTMMYELNLAKGYVTKEYIYTRTGPGYNYAKLSTLYRDTEVSVMYIEGEWAKCKLGEDTFFVRAQDIAVRCSYNEALSGDEMAAVYAEAAEQQKKKAEEEAAKRLNNTVTATIIQTSPYNVTNDEAYLLACVVSSEAGGESYEGKLAVANIVLNRLKSGIYGSSIYGVVYAPGQFTVATNGMLASAISNGPDQGSIDAANAALAGENNVPNYTSFCSLKSAQYEKYAEYTIICNQVFYRR